MSIVYKTGPFKSDNYRYPDNPAYVIKGGTCGWAGKCIGFKNVAKIINCTRGGNGRIRRLCPCKGISDVSRLSWSTFLCLWAKIQRNWVYSVHRISIYMDLRTSKNSISFEVIIFPSLCKNYTISQRDTQTFLVLETRNIFPQNVFEHFIVLFRIMDSWNKQKKHFYLLRGKKLKE